MNDTVAVLGKHEVLQPGDKTLEELASIANDAHHGTIGSLVNALQHALKAGDALLEARTRFNTKDGQGWLAWSETNLEMSSTTAGKYIRLAYYKKHIPEELLNAPYNHNRPGLTVALEYLRGLPPVGSQGGVGRSFDWDEARRLSQSGVPNKEIARMLGVAPGTVRRATLSVSERRKFDARKSRMRRQRERARQRAEIEAMKAPPDLAEAYALIRRALQRIQASHDQTKSTKRGNMTLAISNLHHAEDAIAREIRERA